MVRLGFALVLASGCSLALVRGPAEPVAPPPVPLACTTSRTTPAVDLALGALLGWVGGGVAYGLAELGSDHCPNDTDCKDGTKPALITAAVFALPWWISSYVGFARTGRCRDAHAARGALP